MSGLPTVTVLLDDGTGSFPYDITSKCLLADGFAYTRGREDWQDGVTAGTLSLTLNNSDGRFTPGSTIINATSPIKVDQRIRVKVTTNGVTFTRFTGYVKSWPVSWPATVSTFATVQVTATDAQARAERRVLRSVVEEELFEVSPSKLYTLGEAAGSTSAADSSGNQAPALTLAGSGSPVVFGTDVGPTTDGLSAAHFAGGQFLVGDGSLIVMTGTPAASFVCAFVTTAVNGGLIGRVASAGPGVFISPLGVSSTGHLATDIGTIASAATVTDGALHVGVVTLGGGTSTLYLDGTSVGTGPALNPTYIMAAGELLVGTLGYVAVLPTTLSPTQVSSISQAMLTGFAGESGTARITRTAGYANLPLGTLDTSLTNVAFTDITGRSAWDVLQEVADAEGGVVFIDGSGNLTFHNRNRPAAKTAPDLTIDVSYLTADPTPTQDDQRIINYVETTAQGTGLQQLANSATSEATHGRYPDSVSYLVTTDAEALDRANWIVGILAEPSTRYGTLTINLYKLTAAQQQAVLAAVEINCWLRVTTMPSQTTGGTTADVVVEGVAEHVSATEWTLTLNVVNRSLFTAFILDSATFGVLDSSRLYF